MPLRDEWPGRAARWLRMVLTTPAADATSTRLETPEAARAGARQVVAVFAATRVALLLATYFGFVLVQAPTYSNVSLGVSSTVRTRRQAIRRDAWTATRGGLRGQGRGVGD